VTGVVALICRVSPRPDGKVEGVDDQEKWGRAYAATRWPGSPVEVFADRAVSATNGDYREGLERFLKALADDRVAHAWAVEQSRVSRETDGRYPWFAVAAQMDAAGVGELHTDRDGIVRVGDAVAGIKAVLAAEEVRRMRRRVKDKKDELRAEGNLRRVLGGVPTLGYTYRDGDPDWSPEPGAARLLRDVAAQVLADPEHRVRTAYEAAMKLARHRKVRDAAGRVPTENMVRDALQRPATAGLITEAAAREGEYGKVVGRAATITDPPLPEQTWRDLRAVFGGRKLGRRVSNGDYWAGPLLRCGKCGNPMSGEQQKPRRGKTGTPVPYYRCMNPHPSMGITRPCRGCSIRAADVNQMIQRAVERWAATSPAFAAASAVRAGQATERDRLAAELADERRRWTRLAVRAARGEFDDDLWAEAEQEHDATVARIGRELAAITENLAAPPMPSEVRWDKLTGDERRALAARALVMPVKVAPGNGGGAALTATERIALRVRK
jgi:DNA invertase Pin-like site-specific DNA recombinase